MAKRTGKVATKVKELFNQANTGTRVQWEYINQKGYDFAHDNQLSHAEKQALEDQGMPTFTINRIIPIVEMLNFYATANKPRWQAVGAEGSDSDVAAVFADVADWIWYNSKGSTLLSNAINDAVTKSQGFLVVTVDPDQDRGMGEVVIQQPDPFDVFVDKKSRDMLYRDAGFILIRKVLPKSHLLNIYPEYTRKIKKASPDASAEYSQTEKAQDMEQKDFHYKDIVSMDNYHEDELIEYYELYEKIKVAFRNVFYQVPPTPEQMKQIQAQVQKKLQDMQTEMQVQLMEQQQQMQQAVQEGKMLPERMQLEMKKAQEMMANQLKTAEASLSAQIQQEVTKVENKVITEKEYDILMKNKEFASMVVEAVKFYNTRIKQSCIVGDKTLYEKIIPNLTEYPIVPIPYKWTGTPYPISAVSPLIGKQRELNKAHQLMIHNASLGSSLRWTYEEGSIDTAHWEQYSSAPGALLPIRKGFNPPKEVIPFQLNNAFFGIVQNGKSDMEYLAGIYSSMQGDTQQQHETFRGMLALDEYGTRRIKQWLKASIEPALQQIGTVVKEMSQAVYTAHKVIRLVQPNNIKEEKTTEINIPIYNDFGEAIGKFNDYTTAKFDVRIIAGSTLPVNRWAYLSELKELMKLGVIDDIALLAETDIKNKERIVKRKSLYAQLQSQLQQQEEALKDKEGTIETLERQLVQAGIKGKVLQGAMEVTKKVADTKARIEGEYTETEAKQKLLRNVMAKDGEVLREKANMAINNLQKQRNNT